MSIIYEIFQGHGHVQKKRTEEEKRQSLIP